MMWSKRIINAIRFIFIVNAVYLAVLREFLLVGLLLGSLALTLIPEVFTKVSGIKITMTGRVIFTIFLLGTQWLGTYLRFYDSLAWWDIMLHFSSGILLGYAGILMLIWIDRESMLKGEIRPVTIIFFSFLFSVACAVFWEIMEFSSDTLFGSNTQLGSLTDTMGDMIFGTIGAALFAFYLFIMASKKRNSPLNSLIQLNQLEKKDE